MLLCFTVEIHTNSPVEVEFAKSALLICTFEGYLPSDKYIIQWRNENGDNVTSDTYFVHDRVTSNFMIQSVSIKDEGTYTCELLSHNITGVVEVRIKGNFVSRLCSVLTTKYNIELTFAQPNSSVYNNTIANTVQLNCTITYSSRASFFWKWTGPAVSDGRTDDISTDAHTNILTIHNPSDADNGLYSCEATYVRPIYDNELVCTFTSASTNFTVTNSIELILTGKYYYY